MTNRAAEVADWRRHLHAHPELMYEVHETARYVAEMLRQFGCGEVVEGIGRTGVVGLIRGRSPGPTVGLRADMDALPITERRDLPHKSRNPGVMHACGHDGHTAMLLGAARELCDYRDFDGSVAVIFQPAEEGGAGGLAMVEDGMMERFGIQRVFGLHNKPGLPLGQFAIRPGAIMASTDCVTITVRGLGGHAAMPHLCADPVVAAAAIVQGLQTLASRTLDPLDPAVLSITNLNAGEGAFNVIPEEAVMTGTVRALSADVRDAMEAGIARIAPAIAAAHGCEAHVDYDRRYPVTVNDATEAAFAAAIAKQVAGEGAVDDAVAPMMGGEDFSYMLEARPGAFIFMGNGDSAGLHHPDYDFDDRAIPYGMAYWTTLAKAALAA